MENLDLYKRICEAFGEESSCIENLDYVEVDGVKYTYAEESELDTIDEGKYQYGGRVYAIGELDETTGWDIKEVLFYVEQDFTQVGSYFSCQEREFEAPYIVEPVEVTVTEWKAV